MISIKFVSFFKIKCYIVGEYKSNLKVEELKNLKQQLILR